MKSLFLIYSLLNVPASYVDCYDGDTCTFMINLGLGIYKEEKIRICDIDAPEMKSGDMAIASKKFINMRLKKAKEIDIYISGGLYSPRRSFNRLLGEIYADGNNIGKEMLSLGHATKSKKRCILNR